MRNKQRLVKLTIVILLCAALLAPGDNSWGDGEFYVVATGSWKRNGSNMYYMDGNVGIGTTTPDFPLTVVKSVPGGSVIYAKNFATSLDSFGVTGQGSGDGGGVRGYSGGGKGPGVFGSSSGVGAGVSGFNTGSSHGVYGASSGEACGIYGLNSAGPGAGVQGVNNAGGSGVLGSASGQSAAVFGFNNDTGPGVHGRGSQIGVIGEGSIGVLSHGDFICDNNSTVHGNSYVNGTKNAVVPTSYGYRKLYSQESPEVWFEDFGEGKLVGGLARIELDPLFLETVTINDKNPLKVFIQLNDDCNGVYVQRRATGFEVKELRAGTSSARFTYRVVAKRMGFETARLEAAGDDPKFAALKTPQK